MAPMIPADRVGREAARDGGQRGRAAIARPAENESRGVAVLARGYCFFIPGKCFPRGPMKTPVCIHFAPALSQIAVPSGYI
jgi:hypothetical protein